MEGGSFCFSTRQLGLLKEVYVHLALLLEFQQMWLAERVSKAMVGVRQVRFGLRDLIKFEKKLS